eukprot:GFUD01007636.1.p1 GENE.GFUD01007636.1~~GFUD01007636.1.p1  ORF type:complete len:355 (-),score=102.24 GFUD01007636.1:296-1360(-)
MDKTKEQLERDLVRAERSIQFMQKEQQIILSGLHQELATLTQKCSDLQFSLAMQAESAKNEEQLKETITKLQDELESQYLSQCSLKDQLSTNLNREAELNSQITWEKLQFQNQLDSLNRQLEARDSKILQLKKEVEVKVGVAKLQAHVKQIYIDNSAQAQNNIQDVARRARSPLGIRRRSRHSDKPARSEASDDSFESYSSLFSSLNDERDATKENSNPTSVPNLLPPHTIKEEEKQSRRSKVFRHHIRLDGTKLSNEPSSPPLPSPSPTLYSFSTPPLSLPERGDKTRLGRRSTLPLDYRATVATLPNIAAKKETAREATEDSYDVTTLVVKSALPKFDSDSEMTNYFLNETS